MHPFPPFPDMKQTLLLAAAWLCALPMMAGTPCKTFAEASSKVKDDGYILYVYGPDWDRTSPDFMKPIYEDAGIQAAAGEAMLILAPYYQRPTDKQEAEQTAAWGTLNRPHPHSPQTYPALHFYDKDGHIYAFLRGPQLMHASKAEIAESVKARVAAHKQQAELLAKAEKAQGVEQAKLLGEAAVVPLTERPDKIVERIKAADPQDASGYVRRLTFYPEGEAEKNVNLSLSEGIALVEKAIADPAYTDLQKQQWCAMAIGYLHRNGGESNSAEIIKWAQKMKAYAPDSYLGHSADIVVAKWAGAKPTYVPGSYFNPLTSLPKTGADKDKKDKKKKKK